MEPLDLLRFLAFSHVFLSRDYDPYARLRLSSQSTRVGRRIAFPCFLAACMAAEFCASIVSVWIVLL